MAAPDGDVGAAYSPKVGLVFLFNLIVGTGALAIPAAFSNAGYVLGTLFLIILAVTGFLTCTYMIEAMSITNAVLAIDRRGSVDSLDSTKSINQSDSELPIEPAVYDERARLLDRLLDIDDLQARTKLNEIGNAPSSSSDSVFHLETRVEMGRMAHLYFTKTGIVLFYITICVCLFGDLSIYTAAVAESLLSVTCTYARNACNITFSDQDPCWEQHVFTRKHIYQVYVILFVLILGPFVFFNVQKTKFLQLFTTLLRWFALFTMVIAALIHLMKGQGTGQPDIVNIHYVPTLFGVCVYSFMCHHSLPSLLTPITPKSSLLSILTCAYLLVLSFYLFLAYTGAFSFSVVRDLYTLNFEPNYCDVSEAVISFVPLQYFLTLLPVFVLSTNYPIIGITLRNNLQSIFAINLDDRSSSSRREMLLLRLCCPLLTLAPPTLVALSTHDLQLLVGVTGAFAGAAVQYVIPTLLVILARRWVMFTPSLQVSNPHQSPFQHCLWSYLVLLWTIVCVGVIASYYILKNLQNI